LKTELLIDGLNTFIRHFTTNPMMSLYNDPCGAISGTIGTIYRGVEKYKPDLVTVVWEGGGSSRRKALYPDYKAGRKPVSLNRPYADYIEKDSEKDNWEWQLRTLIKLIPMLKLGQVYVDDAEADDAIAYICKWKNPENVNIIVSTDHDYLQLVNEKTRQWTPRKCQSLYDVELVRERFHTHPINMPSVRAYIGDKSDNIEGLYNISYKRIYSYCPIVKENEFVSTYDIQNYIRTTHEKKLYNARRDKRYQELIKLADVDSELIHRNFKLMNLESMQMSATQVDSVNYQYDQDRRMASKLDLKKFMMSQGINNINLDPAGLIFHNTLMTIKNN